VVVEEAPVVQAGEGVGDGVPAQGREVALGDHPRLVQQSAPAVQLVQERGLEGDRRAEGPAEQAVLALDLLPEAFRLVVLDGEAGPLRQQPAQEDLPRGAFRGHGQGRAEARGGEVPRPAVAGEPGHPGLDLLVVHHGPSAGQCER
jgi:hypothetical protein